MLYNNTIITFYIIMLYIWFIAQLDKFFYILLKWNLYKANISWKQNVFYITKDPCVFKYTFDI